MDVPAFSFAMIGLYFFFRFYKSSANKHLYLFALFYSLAGLLKISSLLSFMAIVGVFVLDRFNVNLKTNGKIFKHPLKQVIPIILVLLLQIIWYWYASYYNAKYNAAIFLIGILPMWNLSSSEITEVYHALIEHIRWDYFRRETQLVIVLMFGTSLLFYKRVNKALLFLIIFIAFGLLLFVMFFFEALEKHDYYTINLFVLVPLVLLGFFQVTKSKFNGLYKSIFFRVLLVAFLIHNIDFARRRIENRYHANFKNNFKYVHYIQPLEEIIPYLRSIGIEQDDRVICISDNSINISLYFMNQKGWTNYGLDYDGSKIKEKIDIGAKYLFIYKSETYKQEGIKPYIRNKIGEFENFDIYAL